MARDKRVPKSQSEFTEGKPNLRFPRSNEVRRDQDKLKELTIGLKEIDNTIKWYFDNVIRPEVSEFGQTVKVPVLYGSPEKWKNMQADGHIRDKEGKIQVPLILYRRTGITKNKTLGSKIDGNYPQLYYSQQIKYNQSNRYDQFGILNNSKPSLGFTNTIIPDFVDLTYEVLIWTDSVNHMNRLVEGILYSEGAYWGEPDRFKFRTKIDDFTNTTDLLQDSDRTVRTTFTLQLSGYIITDAFVRSLAKKDAFISQQPGQIIANTALSGSV